MTRGDDAELDALRALRNDIIPDRPFGHREYSVICQSATFTYEWLYESWKRPKRHNRRIERAALWLATHLAAEIHRAYALPSGLTVLNRLNVRPTLNERYEIEAAMHSVVDQLPFTYNELCRLKANTPVGDALFDSDRITTREPAIVERWHSWVWEDDNHVPQTSVEALGASALVAVACLRLNQNLPRVLGWKAESV